MKKHKNLLVVFIFVVIVIVANIGYYAVSTLQNHFANKNSTSTSSNLSTYNSSKMGFKVQYPTSWIVDDTRDTVQINPSSKGGLTYFSVGIRRDLKSLDDIKKTLAPNIQTAPIQISTGSGFEYTDTDDHTSIWLLRSNSIYIIRTYTISEQAHQILSSFKFEN